MRELVYTGFMSLDGVLDSPGSTAEGHRSGGWVMETEFVPEAYSLKGEELAETAALMFGRRSYEAFAPVWPGSEDHAAYKELPKYVVSSSLSDDDLVDGWGPITILRSAEEVATLKQGEGGAIFRSCCTTSSADRGGIVMTTAAAGPWSGVCRSGSKGGDGGNRTHVRDRAKGSVYECVRCSISRPRLTSPAGLSGTSPLERPPVRRGRASRGRSRF